MVYDRPAFKISIEIFFVVDSSVDFTQFKITHFCISLVIRTLDVNATTVVSNDSIEEIIRHISL